MNAITPRLLEDSDTFKQAFAGSQFPGPVITAGHLQGVTPNGPGATGGLRLQSNNADEAYIQILSADANIERYYLKFKTGLMVTSGLVMTTRITADNKYDFINGSVGVYMTADGYWEAFKPYVLTDANVISWDLSRGINFSVTLGGNRTLDFPTSLRLGQRGTIRILQDATGGRTLAFGSGYRFEDAITPPQLNTGAGLITVLTYTVTGSGEIFISGGRTNVPTIVEATVNDIRNGTAGRVVAPDKLWGANAIVPISETDLINGVNFNNFINATVTITGNRLIANPVASTMRPGQSGFITIIMGGAGGYKLTFGDQWWTTNGIIPTISSNVGSITRLYYTVTSANTVDFFFGVSMGRTFNSEVSAYLQAMQVQPSSARAQLMSDLIIGLKADGVWDHLDNLWLLASHDEQASRVNVLRPSKILTKSGTPYFVEDRGWQQSATAGESGNNRLLSPDPYIGSALKRSTVTSVSFGVWQNTAYSISVSQNNLCGDNGSGDKEFIIDRAPAGYSEGDGVTNGNGPYITVGLDNSSQIQVGTPGLKGFKAVSNLGPNAQTFYAVYNNRQSGGGTSGKYGPTSSATANESALFSILNSGSMSRTDNYGTKNRMAAAFTGNGMGPALMIAFYNRLNTYLTAIGAN